MGSKADIVRRLVAALIDACIGAIPALAIPFIGGIIGAAYILTKDAVVYELGKNEDYRNRSIGKRLMNLEVRTDEPYVNWSVSVRRNIPLAIGNVIAIVPIIGWIFGAIIGTLVFVIELVMVLAEPSGRRFGDQLAGTTVINRE